MTKQRGKALVLWSGGAASTWALIRLLRDDAVDVFAHHHIRKTLGPETEQPQHEERLKAVREMREMLREGFPEFSYSESYSDHSAFPIFARDTVAALFVGAQAALSWRFRSGDTIVFGTQPQKATDQESAFVEEMRYLSVLHRNVVQAAMMSDVTPRVLWLEPPKSDAALMQDLPEAIRKRILNFPVIHEAESKRSRIKEKT